MYLVNNEGMKGRTKNKRGGDEEDKKTGKVNEEGENKRENEDD